jgi:4-diphosphocytidyl-2-C-methyl-D-erythritol kinase
MTPKGFLNQLTMKSFAKINLYLEIIGQRADGYHLLDSLMVLVDIFDNIEIEKSDHLELVIKSSNHNFSQQDWRQNIIIKAVNLLAKEFTFDPKIKISLTKNIPVAAGLGGGSSNAATIMLMLNDFYNLGLSEKRLLELGLKIGADVPFFLNALTNKKPVFVSGIGEVLKTFEGTIPHLHLLIVNPNQPLSTKQVFELFAQDCGFKKDKILVDDNQDILTLSQNHNNDLENPAIKIIPKIALILNALKEEKCLLARMSGSGASCFAIFENAAELENCYKKLQKIFPDFYLKKTSFVA